MENPVSKLKFYAIYAMDFDHRITYYVSPKLNILDFWQNSSEIVSI